MTKYLHDGTAVSDATPTIVDTVAGEKRRRLATPSEIAASHRKSGGDIVLNTVAEIAARAAEEAAWQAGAVRRDALGELARLDAVIPRWGEDLIAALGQLGFALDLAAETQALLAAKAAARAKL
jgi:hypothetical protein